MNTVNITLHKIDHDAKKVSLLEISKDNEDLNGYIKALLEKIAEAGSKRKFEFESNTTEIKKIIDSIITNKNYEKEAEKAAKRLLIKEQRAQEQIEHLLHEVQKGVLVQALIEINGEKRFIISKAEYNQYLDELEMKQRQGLPIKKKIYKAFMVEYNKKGVQTNLYVYDTNSNISKYWWQDFLELNEVNTDENNTNEAFETITKNALGKLKSEFPADHNILRNRILGYFKSNKDFEMDHFIETAIGDYEPVDKDFKVAELKTKIRNLPEKKGFDSQFTIKPEVIKAKKLKEIVHLNENIDLHINSHVGDLHEIIEAVKVKGEKYIRIRSDAGYEAFKTI